MPHRSIVAGLGPHRYVASSKIARFASEKEKTGRVIEQRVELAVDEAGRFSARKNTSPQYGQEVVWSGGWIYPRLRYSSFYRRRPDDDGEPARIAERFYGLLPAYARLLGRFLRFEAAGAAKAAGRAAIRVKLRLRGEPLPLRGKLPLSRRWRRSVRVERAEGEALLDRESGAPLEVRLKASWTFARPRSVPSTGIPERMAPASGRMTLDFEQRLDRIGRVSQIAAPAAHEIVDVRRQRLEIERQMVVGERPIDPAWRTLSPNGEPARKRRRRARTPVKPKKRAAAEKPASKKPAVKKPVEKRAR